MIDTEQPVSPGAPSRSSLTASRWRWCLASSGASGPFSSRWSGCSWSASLPRSPRGLGWRPAGPHRQRAVALMLRAVSAIPSLIPARCRGAIKLWRAACSPQCCSGLWPAIRFRSRSPRSPHARLGSCQPGLRSRERLREPVLPFHTLRERVPRPTDGRARDRPPGGPGGRLGHGGLCAEPACPSRAHLNGPASWIST